MGQAGSARPKAFAKVNRLIRFKICVASRLSVRKTRKKERKKGTNLIAEAEEEEKSVTLCGMQVKECEERPKEGKKRREKQEDIHISRLSFFSSLRSSAFILPLPIVGLLFLFPP